MTEGEFAAGEWIERLACALSELAEMQERYRDELDERRRQRMYTERRIGRWIGDDHPSDDLWAFYSRASFADGVYFERHYGPLRVVLTRVRAVLAEHPAWAGVMDPSDKKDTIGMRVVNFVGAGNDSSIIGGLMTRAKGVPGEGFRVASSELNAVLDPDTKCVQSSGFSELATGFHVALFFGLRVSAEVRVAKDMTIVPFERVAAYLHESMLHRVAPEITEYNRWNSVSAIVRPFRWRPEFYRSGEDSEPELDWESNFFEDAEVLIELLAMSHATPVVCLATVPYCAHRTAMGLLGEGNQGSGFGSRRWVRTFDTNTEPSEVNMDAMEETRKAFRERNSERYRDCAPVIARLVEALARSGRFRIEDRILDVAIALERMYELDQGEISFKLKTRAACFLGTGRADRLRVFRDVEELYKMRSAIVHRGKKRSSNKARHEAFTKGFDVARRTVVKLLRHGPPRDWNELVLGGAERYARQSRSGKGTTQPGYRNRSGQVVVRRTNRPGNDHNQVVYELECGGCGHRYGANGSDIWQRKCPECGGGQPGLSCS